MMRLEQKIEENVKIRPTQGYSDSKEIISLILLNLAGGDHVQDIEMLKGDVGFCELAKEASRGRISGKIRNRARKRFRRFQEEGFPSPSSIFRYLFEFHEEKEELKRPSQGAFIPKPNDHLRGLEKVNSYILAYKQRLNPSKVATSDQDATLVPSQKREAFYCYKGFRAYQPLNTYWYEQDLLIHSEFRDGNVPAGYQRKRILEEALSQLPEGVEIVRLRSDTAGYQHELLRYCEEGQNQRFGRIEFAISCDVTKEFRNAVQEIQEEEWRPLKRKLQGEYVESNQQWAEVCFVPNEIASHAKKDSFYRYIAIREPFSPKKNARDDSQEPEKLNLERIKGQRFKIFGIVSNMKWEGEELIHWHRERCGKSEQIHSVMKDDLAGGILPSKYFGVNAAWRAIMILALNILKIFEHKILPPGWEDKRIKAIHLHIFHLPARVLKRARKRIVRLNPHHPSNPILFQARRKILLLPQIPAG